MNFRELSKSEKLNYLTRYYGACLAEDLIAEDVSSQAGRVIDAIRQWNKTDEIFMDFVQHIMVVTLIPTINEARLIAEMRMAGVKYEVFRHLHRHQTFYLIDIKGI